MCHRPLGHVQLARLLLCGLIVAWGVAAWGGGQVRLPAVVGQDRAFDTLRDENICEVAHQWGLAPEHLAFANRVPADEYLYPNRHIVVPLRRILPRDAPRHGLVLNIPERALYLFRGGRYGGFYPVAVGRQGYFTPRGQFHVISKVHDPTWYPPAWADRKTPFPPGKGNPLGNRWIGLSAPRVGIHGTASPYAIGMPVSHGCVRMYPDHILKVFEQVRVGTPVRIEYETVKLGRDAQGRLCMAAFPDVYGLQPPWTRALMLLRRAGLPSSLQARAREIARRQSGIVESLEEKPAPPPPREE